MMFENRAHAPRSPADAVKVGIGFVPEERRAEGLFSGKSLAFNLASANFRNLRIKPWVPWLDMRRRTEVAKEIVHRLQVKTSGIEKMVDRLSGGNQQKVMLAKWLRNEPTVLLLDEPTQGVDVGARAEIFELIMLAARQGAGIMICSSDTKELAVVCDRVIVMSDGRAVAELSGPALSEAALVKAGLEPGARSDSGYPAGKLGGG
jgi:ABC-type sugar transport system ATPase subunit